MEITEVKVFPIQEEKLKAFVSIVFDHCFMVNDIKIIQGKDGLFISMPSRKKKNGEFKDVAHPLNNETRRMIEERVLGEYGHVRGDAPLATAAIPPPAPVAPVAAPAAIAPAVAEQGEGGVGSAAAPAAPLEVEPKREKTLEEVEEMHLRDSFWSVP
jgi:stage V sporulation protein G